MWSPLDEPGLEHLHLVEDDGQILADGVILRLRANNPFRAHYRIHCDVEWRVKEVDVHLLDDVSRNIRLRADGKGNWKDGSGNPILSLNGCFDVDISATPFTNTLAIRRLRLKAGETSDLVAAYIEVPEMRVQPSHQRYTCLEVSAGGGLYRYKDEGLFRGFTADLLVDPDGLVLDYPNLFRRVWPG
jgi:hypothetical protein